MNGNYSPGEIVFGKWELDRVLGAGSFGKVFEATRNDFGSYKAAVKVITIPQNPSEIMEARSEGMDDHSITLYFRSMVDEIVREFEILSQFKGSSNIVSYEDHDVIAHTDGYGWDILIRMELLTPMVEYMQTNPMSTRDVIRLGVDICKALEFCHHYNVIHRDIKPENIFVSKMGDFKLGDFGIARTVEKTGSGLSKKGTYTYMAPEVFRESRYDATVDIYSLGIVLYRLLNNNRAPFLPAPPAPITHADREMSLSRRICGDPLPAPANADSRLAQVILKACAFWPADRYQTASQMRADLEALMDSHTPVTAVAEEDYTVLLPRRPAADVPNSTYRPVRSAAGSTDDSTVITRKPYTEAPAKPKPAKKKKRGLLWLIIGILAVLAVLAVVVLAGLGDGGFESGSGDKPALSFPALSGKQEKEEEEEADLPDSGDLFASMLWGSYDAEGTYVPVEGEEDEYKQDLTEFVDKIRYQTLTYEEEELEVSVLPFTFDAYTNRFEFVKIGDEYFHYDNPEEMEILKEAIVAEYSQEHWENFNRYLDLNLIDVGMCDRTGYTYYATFAYRLEGNKLILSTIEIVDEATFAFTLTDYYSCKMAVDGQNIILSNKGKKITYQPSDYSGRYGSGPKDVNVYGYVFNDSLAYQDIVHIYLSGDPTVDPEKSYTSIEFSDGNYAIDPTHSYNEDGTLTIKWEQRRVNYNGRRETVDDPFELTCEYMIGDGLILKIDGKWYAYQNSDSAYYGQKQLNSEAESSGND